MGGLDLRSGGFDQRSSESRSMFPSNQRMSSGFDHRENIQSSFDGRSAFDQRHAQRNQEIIDPWMSERSQSQMNPGRSSFDMRQTDQQNNRMSEERMASFGNMGDRNMMMANDDFNADSRMGSMMSNRSSMMRNNMGFASDDMEYDNPPQRNPMFQNRNQNFSEFSRNPQSMMSEARGMPRDFGMGNESAMSRGFSDMTSNRGMERDMFGSRDEGMPRSGDGERESEKSDGSGSLGPMFVIGQNKSSSSNSGPARRW